MHVLHATKLQKRKHCPYLKPFFISCRAVFEPKAVNTVDKQQHGQPHVPAEPIPAPCAILGRTGCYNISSRP